MSQRRSEEGISCCILKNEAEQGAHSRPFPREKDEMPALLNRRSTGSAVALREDCTVPVSVSVSLSLSRCLCATPIRLSQQHTHTRTTGKLQRRPWPLPNRRTRYCKSLSLCRPTQMVAQFRQVLLRSKVSNLVSQGFLRPFSLNRVRFVERARVLHASRRGVLPS